jgi:hypothetical protein
MVWFNPNSIANIISMSEAEIRGHKIFYPPGLFKLISKDGNLEMTFQMNDIGLYAYSVSFEGLTHVETIEENGQFFLQRQIESAKSARSLYEMIGRPPYQDFLGIVKNNLLPNISISVNDIMNAEKIFGKDLGSLQGKTIRERPEVVKTSYIDLPIEIIKIHEGRNKKGVEFI